MNSTFYKRFINGNSWLTVIKQTLLNLSIKGESGLDGSPGKPGLPGKDVSPKPKLLIIDLRVILLIMLLFAAKLIRVQGDWLVYLGPLELKARR